MRPNIGEFSGSLRTPLVWTRARIPRHPPAIIAPAIARQGFPRTHQLQSLYPELIRDIYCTICSESTLSAQTLSDFELSCFITVCFLLYFDTLRERFWVAEAIWRRKWIWVLNWLHLSWRVNNYTILLTCRVTLKLRVTKLILFIVDNIELIDMYFVNSRCKKICDIDNFCSSINFNSFTSNILIAERKKAAKSVLHVKNSCIEIAIYVYGVYIQHK